MAWGQTCDKQLSELKMAKFSDSIHHLLGHGLLKSAAFRGTFTDMD